MKKNITINIFGQLYAFDEDAYELLKNYEDSLRSAFSNQPGGHEIADDIEARVAELLNELKANGVEAINIQHVQDIINRIGTPKDIKGDEEEASDGESQQQDANQNSGEQDPNQQSTYKSPFSMGNKRLYRDANNKMLAGVLGGLAGYFNHDATFWRIGYAVLLLICLFSSFRLFDSLAAFLVIGYIVLAVLLPVAKTPEDRLRMKGMEVTPQSLAQEVMDDSKRMEMRNENQQVVNRAGGCILKGCLISIGLMFIIPLVLLLILFFSMLFLPTQLTELHVFSDTDIGELFASSSAGAIIMTVSLIAGLGIIIYCVFHAIMSGAGNVKPMGFKQRLFWLIAWVVCLAAFIASAVWINEKLVKAAYQISRNNPGIHISVDDHRDNGNGISMSEEDMEYFDDEGFQLLTAKDCDGERYTYSGQHYTGDDDERYFDAYNINGGMAYHAQKTEYVTPGLYRLTAVARADRKGENAVFVFAQTDPVETSDSLQVASQGQDSVVVNVGRAVKVSVGRRNKTVKVSVQSNSTTKMKLVPAYGDEGGLLKEQLQKMAENNQLPEWAKDDFNDILSANNGNGYGWSIVSIDSIRVADNQKVVYGISSDPAFNGGHRMTGQWFSACEFHLDRVGD